MHVLPIMFPRQMPSAPSASAAQELLCSELDSRHSSWLSSELSSLALDVLGPSRWLRWREAIEATATFTYFAIHCLGGRQTLGEEYCNVVQVAWLAISMVGNW